MTRFTRRRMMAWLAGCCTAGSVPLAAQPLGTAGVPMVNLHIELRQTERAQQRSAGVDGLRFGAQANERRDEHGARQQLLVLNGGRASLRLAQGRLLRWLQMVPGPNGWMLVPAGAWVETGQGFSVQPRWPGGQAPVMVEVSAAGGRLQHSEVLTTLQLPLGDWVTVAESAEQQEHRERGLLSAQRGDASHSLLVQMRVTAR